MKAVGPKKLTALKSWLHLDFSIFLALEKNRAKNRLCDGSSSVHSELEGFSDFTDFSDFSDFSFASASSLPQRGNIGGRVKAKLGSLSQFKCRGTLNIQSGCYVERRSCSARFAGTLSGQVTSPNIIIYNHIISIMHIYIIIYLYIYIIVSIMIRYCIVLHQIATYCNAWNQSLPSCKRSWTRYWAVTRSWTGCRSWACLRWSITEQWLERLLIYMSMIIFIYI